MNSSALPGVDGAYHNAVAESLGQAKLKLQATISYIRNGQQVKSRGARRAAARHLEKDLEFASAIQTRLLDLPRSVEQQLQAMSEALDEIRATFTDQISRLADQFEDIQAPLDELSDAVASSGTEDGEDRLTVAGRLLATVTCYEDELRAVAGTPLNHESFDRLNALQEDVMMIGGRVDGFCAETTPLKTYVSPTAAFKRLLADVERVERLGTMFEAAVADMVDVGQRAGEAPDEVGKKRHKAANQKATMASLQKIVRAAKAEGKAPAKEPAIIRTVRAAQQKAVLAERELQAYRDRVAAGCPECKKWEEKVVDLRRQLYTHTKHTPIHARSPLPRLHSTAPSSRVPTAGPARAASSMGFARATPTLSQPVSVPGVVWDGHAEQKMGVCALPAIPTPAPADGSGPARGLAEMLGGAGVDAGVQTEEIKSPTPSPSPGGRVGSPAPIPSIGAGDDDLPTPLLGDGEGEVSPTPTQSSREASPSPEREATPVPTPELEPEPEAEPEPTPEPTPEPATVTVPADRESPTQDEDEDEDRGQGPAVAEDKPDSDYDFDFEDDSDEFIPPAPAAAGQTSARPSSAASSVITRASTVCTVPTIAEGTDEEDDEDLIGSEGDVHDDEHYMDSAGEEGDMPHIASPGSASSVCSIGSRASSPAGAPASPGQTTPTPTPPQGETVGDFIVTRIASTTARGVARSVCVCPPRRPVLAVIDGLLKGGPKDRKEARPSHNNTDLSNPFDTLLEQAPGRAVSVYSTMSQGGDDDGTESDGSSEPEPEEIAAPAPDKQRPGQAEAEFSFITGGTDQRVTIWDVVKGAIVEGLVLEGHTDNINQVTAIEGQPGRPPLAASCSDDRTVMVWDLDRAVVRRRLRTAAPALCCALHASDKGVSVAVGSYKLVNVFDIETGQARHALHHTEGLNVYTLAFHPLDHTLVSGGDDKRARVWDLDTGHAITLPAHKSWVLRAIFTHDGLLCTTDQSGQLKLFDPKTGTILGQTRGHTGAAAAVTEVGATHFMTVGYDGNGVIYSRDGAVDKFAVGHLSSVYDVVYDRATGYVVTTGSDQGIRVLQLSEK